jgi:glycerol-3-phosphate dehydrogenase
VDFILDAAGAYLGKAPTRKDVKAIFAGLRPLAAPKEGSTKTKEISRSHKVIVSKSKLVSIIGGKWTTFRKMGEDTVKEFQNITGESLAPSTSAQIPYHGFTESPLNGHWKGYGSDALSIQKMIQENPELGQQLHPNHPYTQAEVVWSTRNEMAMKVEDILSRRIRVLILDAQSALEMAPKVAELMAKEMKKDGQWIVAELENFGKLANKYILK